MPDSAPGTRCGLTDDEVRDWVERSCAEQGVPVPVTDPRVLRQVAILVTGKAPPQQ